MGDPISRLLEAIEAREQKALKAAPGPWRPNAEHDEVYAADDIPVCEGFALSNNQLRNTVDFIVDNDPSSVLRHCKAEREMVEWCQGWLATFRGPIPEGHTEEGALHFRMAAEFLLIKLRHAYGITEEET